MLRGFNGQLDNNLHINTLKFDLKSTDDILAVDH